MNTMFEPNQILMQINQILVLRYFMAGPVLHGRRFYATEQLLLDVRKVVRVHYIPEILLAYEEGFFELQSSSSASGCSRWMDVMRTHVPADIGVTCPSIEHPAKVPVLLVSGGTRGTSEATALRQSR